MRPLFAQLPPGDVRAADLPVPALPLDGPLRDGNRLATLFDLTQTRQAFSLEFERAENPGLHASTLPLDSHLTR